MTLNKNLVSPNGYQFSYWALLVISCIVSLKLFFSSNVLTESFQKEHVDWYLNYSKEVFHPGYFLKGAYFTESMLLPVLANAFGAARSMVAYKIFCSLLTLSILPVATIFAMRFFINLYQATVFIVLLCVSYAYLWNFNLGFPDPLTILLLVWIAFEVNPKRFCFAVMFAVLSHFSLVTLSLLGLLGMIISSSSLSRGNRFILAKALIIGIVFGKLALTGWHIAFDYHPSGRLSWVLQYGLTTFAERYKENVPGFWLMPGTRLLSIYSLILIYFLVLRKWSICLSALFALGLAYVGLFFTVDGYRIFAVIICAPYIWFLKEFILSASTQIGNYFLAH